MQQNDGLTEKVLTRQPTTEAQRHHILTKLTEKINLIKKEIEAFDINIDTAQQHLDNLTRQKEARISNLERYSKQKEEIQKLDFAEQEVIEEPTVIVESVEEPKEEPPKEEEPSKEDLVIKAIKDKGFSLDEILEKLK